MGSEVCAGEARNEEIGNCNFTFKAGDGDGDEESKNVARPGPLTPQEKHNLSSPPWGNNENASLLETPKEMLFDSFAQASDKFLLAPHHRKYIQESRNHVVRRLNFFTRYSSEHAMELETSSASNWYCQEEEEERLFEIVYGTIMDAILAEQQQGKETPKSSLFLNGIFADTCPAPPIKSTRKHNRFIDKEICKKLAF